MNNEPIPLVPAPPSNPAKQPGPVVRFFRAIWKGFCAIGGGLIAGGLAGFGTSNLWVGLAAAIPGMVVGWYFGKFVSPVDFFAHPFTTP